MSGELRRDSDVADRFRVVRSRARRVHRRVCSVGRASSNWPTAEPSSWTKWASCRRDADRAASRPAGARIRASGRQPADPRRRARDCRDESRPQGGDRRAGLPARSLLPAERVPDRDAAAARAADDIPLLVEYLRPPVLSGRARRSPASAARRSICCSRTPGRATFASCRTSSSAQ